MRRFHSTQKSRNNQRDDVFMNVFYNAVKAYEKFNNLRVEQLIASNQNSRRTSSRSGYGTTKIAKHPRRGTIFKKSIKFLEKNDSDPMSVAFKPRVGFFTMGAAHPPRHISTGRVSRGGA